MKNVIKKIDAHAFKHSANIDKAKPVYVTNFDIELFVSLIDTIETLCRIGARTMERNTDKEAYACLDRIKERIK